MKDIIYTSEILQRKFNFFAKSLVFSKITAYKNLGLYKKVNYIKSL